MNDSQNVVNNNSQYTNGNFIPNDYQVPVDNSSNDARQNFFINSSSGENVQNSEQMSTATGDYSNISMGQYVQPDTTNYQINQVENQQTEMMQTMPTTQQNMMGYQTMNVQAPMQQNVMYQQQTNAYQAQMPVTQTDMGVVTYQNANLMQTQAMPIVQQDTNVYQNSNVMQQNNMGYVQPQVTNVPYPTPGIQPNNVYQSPNLPQPIVSSQVPVSQNIYQIDTSAQTMGMQQQMPQQNMMYQQQQVTPSSYPALGSINNQYQNNNMMQTNFQNGQTVYQNTGATQIGRMNTYQTRMNRPSSSSYTPEKKKFKFGNFLLLLIFIAVIAFGIYYFFLQGNGSYTGFANLKAIYDPNKLIRVHSDGLAGYIKTNGDVVISPQYRRSTDFYGGYAAVKLPDEDNYKVIDEKGEVVFQLETSATPEYLLDYDIWILDDCIYNNKMEKVVSNVSAEYMGLFSFVDEENSKVGIVDHKGKVLYETTGTEIEIDYNYLSEDDIYFIVHVSGSPDVIVSKNTKEVVYTAAEGTSIDSEGDSIYLIESDDAEKYIYIEDGKVLYEFTDAFYVRMHNAEKKILKIARLYPLDDYYFDVTSGVQVAEVEEVRSYELDEEVNGYKEISCETDDNYEGLMKDDEIILECKYDAVAFLEEKLFSYIKNRRFREYVLLREDEKAILYDLVFKKKVFSAEGVDRVGGGDGTIFLVFYASDDSDNTKDIVYNLMTGKTMEFTTGENVYMAGTNYFIVYNAETNTAEYYNAKMKNIYSSSNYISM